MRLPPSSRPTSNNVTSGLPGRTLFFVLFVRQTKHSMTCLTKTTAKSVLLPPLRSFIVKMMSSQALTSISSMQYPQENSGRQSRSGDESRRCSVRVRVTKSSLRADEPERRTLASKNNNNKKKISEAQTWNSLHCDPRQEGGSSKTLQEDESNEIVHSQHFRTFTRRRNVRRGRSAPRLT